MRSILIFYAFLILTTACAPYEATKENNNRPGNKPGSNPSKTQLALADENLLISTDRVTIENSFAVIVEKEIKQISKNYFYTMGDSDAHYTLQDFDLTAGTGDCRTSDNHIFITDSYQYTEELRNSQVILLKKNRTYRLQVLMDNLSCTRVKNSFIFRRL